MHLAANGVRPISPPGTESDLSSFPRKRWLVATPDEETARELSRLLKCGPVLAKALVNRGFAADSLEDARTFLRPKLADLDDPTSIPGCESAATRIAQAVEQEQSIVIYGDYDVDGITATSILWHALTTLGHPAGKVSSYVPHRIDEGYGVNSDALRQLKSDGADLVITVDCGITAVEPAAVAREIGLDLIITDHHEWKPDAQGEPALPDVSWLVHPRLPGSTANDDLVGAGVAFKLAWQVGKSLAGGPKVAEGMKQFLMDAMALAALGTVADVGPLVGENRLIVTYGLGNLTKSRLAGVRALIDGSGLGGQDLDSFDVGFKLGPRLNACGRMGHAREAVEMLTVADAGRARDIAEELESQNRDRQNTERRITRQAEQDVIDHGWDGPDFPAIVVAGEGWHPGVVGIVASRLVDKFSRPAIVLGINDEGEAAGSGRSIDGFNLAESLNACDALLTSHGGHAMAAGMRLSVDNINAFREKLTGIAKAQLSADALRPSLRIEAEIEVDDVSEALAKELGRLAPFGRSNSRPILVLRGLTLLTARAVGKTSDHLQLQFDSGTPKPLKGIAFGCGKLASDLSPGTALDVAAEVTLNEWNGRVSAELMVRDLAPA